MSPTHTAGAPALSAVRRHFEISLYLLLLTSVLALVSTGKLDPVSIVVAPLALLVKGYRWWRGCEPELSHRIATWAVVAYFGFFPIDLWVFSRALAAGAPNTPLYASLLANIHLMLFAMIVRAYSARTTRDYLFLALLAFGNVLASAILTVDTTFLIFFLVFLILAVSTFVGLEMRRTAEGAAAPPLESGTPAARRLHRALSLVSVSVAVSVLAVGAVIFFVLPRFTAGYLSGFNLQPTLISGFSDNVELGQIGEIKKNSAVVMRVRLEGGHANLGNLRWRGIALTTFDGRRWFTEEHEQVVVTPEPDGWYLLSAATPMARQDAIPLRYTVLLEPMATDALFVAAKPNRLRGRFWSDSAQGGPFSRRSYLLVDKTNSIFNPFHNYAKLRYEGFSYLPAVPGARLRAASASYPEEVRQTYLQLPPLDPRIPALAQEVTAQAQTPYDKAMAIENHLRTRYGYTLDLSGTPTAQPLVHFLFERRAGHCEYFAAAMTVMLRTLGIPARYVNGFLPGEYNEVGDDFIIRSSNAHSWVEVYFPEFGWIPFDPTPPTEERARGWLGKLALYWDWFELTWSEWVINYDFLHQIMLAQNFQKASREWSERMRNRVERSHRAALNRLKLWQARALAWPYTLPLAGAALLAMGLLLRGRALRELFVRLWGLHLAPSAELTPGRATLHYQHLLRLLARRGLAKPPGQTPREFAASLGPSGLSARVEEFTELYHAARFGERHAETTQMSQLLSAIKALLRSHTRTDQ